MHMQGEGGNYLDLVAQINNTLCLDKIIGTSFHANNAHGIFFLSTLSNWNNICLKICMAFSSWAHWRTKRNIENKKGKRILANILSFLSVFCSRPAILKNTSHDTRSNLSYMHTLTRMTVEKQRSFMWNSVKNNKLWRFCTFVTGFY